MPKERSINPAAQQRKQDKQKEIAKNKKQVNAVRNEKLARRNPERLQKQVDELKELEKQRALRPKEQETLRQLERDLKGVHRAREALGDAAPKFAQHSDRRNAKDEQAQRRQHHLGKRRRDEQHAQDSGSDTDPEVRSIPMPRDTPPPIPPEFFRNPRFGGGGTRGPHSLPTKPAAPPAPAQTVYSSAPQIRDLRKEAVRFMPSTVAQHKKRAQGDGRLLEPEEADRLEKAGYTAAKKATEAAEQETEHDEAYARVRAEQKAAEGANSRDLEEEARRFEAEMAEIYPDEDEVAGPKGVRMEEVEDQGD